MSNCNPYKGTMRAIHFCKYILIEPDKWALCGWHKDRSPGLRITKDMNQVTCKVCKAAWGWYVTKETKALIRRS